MKIYEGDHFNKVTFIEGSAKCYCLKPAPYLLRNGSHNAFKLPPIGILGITVTVILVIRDNYPWNFRDKRKLNHP